MNKLVIHGIYRHYKGDSYIVEDICYNSDTAEKMVLYRALYGDGRLWVRPYKEFLSDLDHTKHPGIEQNYRFELQAIDSVKEKNK